MNLSHLYYFKTLAETKNYQKTAQAVSVSQPTLSLAISGLEKELAVPLFVRKKGSVELTDDGRAFYQYVSTSLRFLDKGLDLMKERSGNTKRVINIGTIYSAQSTDWSQLIYDFRRQMHGDVQINIKQSTTPDLLRKIKNATIDVAFAGTMGPDPDLVFHPCWTQEATLVVNRLHPFSDREWISLDDLRGHYVISYDLRGPLGPELTDLVGHHNLSIDYNYADEITLASIVAANPDIMAIACHSWLLNSYDEEIRTVKIAEAPSVFRQLFTIYRSDVKHPYIVNEFIKLARSLYPDQE